jgi:hypothetical protein
MCCVRCAQSLGGSDRSAYRMSTADELLWAKWRRQQHLAANEVEAGGSARKSGAATDRTSSKARAHSSKKKAAAGAGSGSGSGSSTARLSAALGLMEQGAGTGAAAEGGAAPPLSRRRILNSADPKALDEYFKKALAEGKEKLLPGTQRSALHSCALCPVL